MAKLTLSDLVNLNNPASAVATINANSASTEAALEKTLSRDGTSPNSMESQLDMNSNRIINLPSPTFPSDPVRLSDLTDLPDFTANGFVSVLDYGAVNDGVTQTSTEIQACIDANKGRTIVVPAGDYQLDAPIVLDGHTYDGTKIIFLPGARFIIAVRPTASDYNFLSSIWTAFVVREADDVHIEGLHIVGQRTLQPTTEYIHSLLVMGAHNFYLNHGRFYETRGDCIYVTQKNFNSDSRQSQFVTLENTYCWNDELDGRNALTVAGCDDLIVNNFVSYLHGSNILYEGTNVNCTVTVANPAVFTKVAHGLTANTPVAFKTTGTLPTGLRLNKTGQIYYVLSAGLTADTFQISTQKGGTPVEVTGAGTGTLSYYTGLFVPEPGGIDFESNFSFQSNKRAALSNINITTGGTTGFGLIGPETGTESVRDIVVNNLIVTNVSVPNTQDGSGNWTQVSNYGLVVIRASAVKITNATVRFLNAYGNGVVFSDSVDVTADVQVAHVQSGASIGALSYDVSPPATGGILRSNIRVFVRDTCRFGVQIGHVIDSTISGKVFAPVNLGFSAFAVFVSGYSAGSGFVLENTSLQISVEDSATWVRSYRSDPTFVVTPSNCVMENCSLAGSTWAGTLQQFGDLPILRRNVDGITARSAVPSSGLWLPGQIIINSAPTIGTPSAGKIVHGWHRVTSGTTNIVGTDWHILVIANT